MQKTDAGLYSIEFDTQQTNLKIFKTVSDKIIALALIVLNIVLITTSLFDIAEQRKTEKSVQKILKQEQEQERLREGGPELAIRDDDSSQKEEEENEWSWKNFFIKLFTG